MSRLSLEIKASIDTFMFLNLVITCTASADNGTGEPIPISWPVSRGKSLGLGWDIGVGVDEREDGSLLAGVAVDSTKSGAMGGVMRSVFCTESLRWSGGAGAVRSSLGMMSIPPLPRFGPCIT
jgi:hypothetical protein